MSDYVISLDELSKRYVITEAQQRYRTLRDSLASGAGRFFRRSSSRRVPQELWALRKLTLDINRGEAVGVIGRNGAGKSTLLKVLSRITEPTAGCATIRGRIGSL